MNSTTNATSTSVGLRKCQTEEILIVIEDIYNRIWFFFKFQLTQTELKETSQNVFWVILFLLETLSFYFHFIQLALNKFPSSKELNNDIAISHL